MVHQRARANSAVRLDYTIGVKIEQSLGSVQIVITRGRENRMDKVEEAKKDLLKTLDSLDDLREHLQQEYEAYEKTCQEFWDKLSYDDKLKAFYSVVKRIHQAELVDRGSYRWALYDVFKFDMDSYGIGMDCGYMELHNSIYTLDEIEKLMENK
jgi:predicted patatin/cPLA2 family phospholipase